GFLEEAPVSRLHREALVTAIWEGSSNIQALDMLEVMQKKGAHELFLDEFLPMLRSSKERKARQAAESLESPLSRLADAGPSEIQWYAKGALDRLADSAAVALLYHL